MTDNMKRLIDQITTAVNSECGDDLPTLEYINRKAEQYRTIFASLYPISDGEFERVKKELATNILHKIGFATTLRGYDAEHKSWYFIQENDGYYWNRYKTYLLNVKHWGIDVVNRLNQTTDEIMDDLGDPKDCSRPFQRRGLLLGDVQSGKTATYTAICNKAADAGYRVVIVLAGMMENLRFQTQERLDAEFVGKESKYTLDKKAEQEIRNKPVGVGKIPPIVTEKSIACFTSVATDFNKAILRAFNLDLRNLSGTALFVVKKNKSILNNLYKWLRENNSSHETGLIDLPLLLIDDEADNASVNTNSEEKDPTAINMAIRNILNCFRQASYLGITATPFANIFIDPDKDDATRDLFPKDFLTVLPTPELYIGADKIFGNGDADEWDKEVHPTRTGGIYGNSIIPIKNDEQEAYYVFKHKKELAEELADLPSSMREAIRYFFLACAISDIRQDNTEHRSMLVNVSRYTMVQNVTADLIEQYVNSIKSDLENYSGLPIEKSMEIKNIFALSETWNNFCLEQIANIQWADFLRVYLLKSARRIEVRTVNQQHGASSLNYFDYKEIGMRVIAVGGNSLSRGLTLEGLCVSYFYRNTMMYDTLLQMGRWFGYRPNYDDLFKIWMAEDAVDWYGYITDAVNELKDELQKMKRQNQTPEQFGLKVRQAPGSLLITARNKMRTATYVKRPITVSGRMIETPRLKGDAITIEENANLCKSFIQSISAEINYMYDDAGEHNERRVFDVAQNAISEIVALIKKLYNNLQISNFFITADHGFLYRRNTLLESQKYSNIVSKKPIEASKRYVITDDELIQVPYTSEFDLLGQDEHKVIVPFGYDIFKTQGAGVQYVHGGASLQETIVPIVHISELNAKKGEKLSRPVGVRLKSIVRKITNRSFALDFEQYEKVEDKVQPITCVTYFVDEEGNKVSGEYHFTANSSCDDISQRVTRIRFTLKNIEFDRAKRYFLMLCDEENLGEYIEKEQFTIDILGFKIF